MAKEDNLTPWKKGQSGNPKGRPRGKSLTTLIGEILDTDDGGETKAKRLMDAGVKAALSGDFRFWNAIMERIEGKVPDKLEADSRVVFDVTFPKPIDDNDDDDSTSEDAGPV